ncbi:MAG: hypothetical protein WBO84_06250 [Acidimicrobiia bacterium]
MTWSSVCYDAREHVFELVRLWVAWIAGFSARSAVIAGVSAISPLAVLKEPQ